MSDLISRKALLEEMNAYKFDTVNDVARRTEHTVKAHMFELVENQPTAFDLEDIAKQINNAVEETAFYRHRFCENVDDKNCVKQENCEFCIAQHIIQMLKSTVIVTNEKNGG